MTPALKLLLCTPFLLGVSHAEASQRPLLATAAATPAPALPRGCSGLGCWKTLLFKRESNVKDDFVPPPRINQSLPHVNHTNEQWRMMTTLYIPQLQPTKCPSKIETRGDLPAWEGICNFPCMRQYMTPVVKNVVHYKGVNKKCKPKTVPVTYTGLHWGDSYGDHISRETLFELAGVDLSHAYKPERCNKTKSSKTRKDGKALSTSKHRRAMITVPAPATVHPTHRARGFDSQRDNDGHGIFLRADKNLNQEELYTPPLRHSKQERGVPASETFEPGTALPPSPTDSASTACLSKRRPNRSRKSKKARTLECTDYTSCYIRCTRMREREEEISSAIIFFVVISVAIFVGIILGRKVYRRVRDRRSRRHREVSGESANAERQTEEVVEVVEVEPRPEERPVREKKDVDVPTVIVEEPTPTHPRSMDGTSNDEIQHVDRGRLRVARASGSEVYGSESSARLRHE